MPTAVATGPSSSCPWRSPPGCVCRSIGTSLVTAPAWLRRRLVAWALGQPIFNLELHGIDLADAETDGLPPALIARQPDLRLPLARKLAALDDTLTQARAAGARFVPLRILAAETRI